MNFLIKKLNRSVLTSSSVTMLFLILPFGHPFFVTEIEKEAFYDKIPVEILVEVLGCFFYLVFNLLDLSTALIRIKYRGRTKVRQGKTEPTAIDPFRLYKTIIKFVSVLFLTGMFCFLAMLLNKMNNDSVYYWTVVWAIIIVWVLAINFEFYSIGRNLEIIYGEKPLIFTFWSKVTRVMEHKVIDKIDKF